MLSVSDAKREFGDLLLKSQHAPIGINKNGKPVAVVVSMKEYRQLEEFKESNLKSLLQEGLDDLNAGKISDGKEVLARLHRRVT